MKNLILIFVALFLICSFLSCESEDESNDMSDSDELVSECKDACKNAVNCLNEVFPGSGNMDDREYGCELIYQIGEACGNCWIDCMNSNGSCEEKSECVNNYCKESGGPCDL